MHVNTVGPHSVKFVVLQCCNIPFCVICQSLSLCNGASLNWWLKTKQKKQPKFGDPWPAKSAPERDLQQQMWHHFWRAGQFTRVRITGLMDRLVSL